MKRIFFLLLVGAAVCINSSCTKSTSSEEYDSVWRPYSGTAWTKPSSGLENFSATEGGFSFDATISSANTIDTLAVKLAFIPSQYIISNIESGKDAQFTVSATVSSVMDSMKLKTVQYDPVKHDTTRYAYVQFGKVSGIVRTYGKDNVLTQPRSFASDALYAYSPSIHPDSCSRQIYLQIILNWKSYTGAAVLDTLKTTKISVQVKDVALTVSGVDILK